MPSSGMHLASLMQVIMPALLTYSLLKDFCDLLNRNHVARASADGMSAQSLTALCHFISAAKLALEDELSIDQKALYKSWTLSWLNLYCQLATQYQISVCVCMLCCERVLTNYFYIEAKVCTRSSAHGCL
jgi:hypothetical protein